MLTAAIVALAVILLLGLLVSVALAAPPGFSDVPETHPFFDAISELASLGVIGGYADGRFGPDEPVTRQQFAKMVVLAGGYAVSEADVCRFADVVKSGPGSLFPDNYVAVCAARGITTGKTATLFDPYNSITRLQVASMVVRAAQDLRPGLLLQPPVGWQGAAAWAGDPVHGANAALAGYGGLLEGLDLSEAPTGAMTRGEVAQVLSNLALKLAEPAAPATVALLLAVAEGNGAFAVSPNKAVFARGETATVTAVPAAGYVFAGWGGAALGDSDPFANPLTIVMVADTTLTASFKPPTTEFENLGGSITSAPAVCSRSYGLMDVFARGSGGSLIHKAFDGSNWSSWEDLGGAIKAGSDPAAVSWGQDRLDVFVRSTDDAVWHRARDAGEWSEWENLGGPVVAGPAAAFREAAGGLRYADVFIVAGDGRLMQRTLEGSGWQPWVEVGSTDVPARPGSSLAAVTWGRSRIDLFMLGGASGFRHNYLPPWGGWGMWRDLTGDLSSNCSASTQGSWAEGVLDVFARGRDGDLWHRSLSSGLWSAWHGLKLGPVASAPAVVSCLPERVDVFVRGTDGSLWHKVLSGHSWRS